ILKTTKKIHEKTSAQYVKLACPISMTMAAICLAFKVNAANAAAGVTEEASAKDFATMTLEELSNIEIISVSRSPERILNAPAAITVITNEDIRRSGATTIPEALRLADNLNVAQKSSHSWAISARGFNTELANKM